MSTSTTLAEKIDWRVAYIAWWAARKKEYYLIYQADRSRRTWLVLAWRAHCQYHYLRKSIREIIEETVSTQ